MSAIGGIVSFRGGSVNGEVLTMLGQALEEYGPDGGSNVLRSSVGMVHRAFHTTLESRSERQPLAQPNGHLLAWDGRLDNREELIELLRDDLRGDHTDSSIVLGAYKRWGKDFLARIIGDFALSLWDPTSRTLFLARDPVGARLLFYHANSERLVWSSRLEPLLGLPELKLEVDDEYIAGYLTARTKQGLTPYRHIYAVPPANLVIAGNGRIRLQRFWGLDPSKEIRYRSDGEYEEHFRQLLSEAVRTRLRAHGPVWADLSGGLDSSSIVCVADQIIEKEPGEWPRLETVSAVFDDSPKSDERRFIRLVEGKRGQAGHHFKESEYPLLADSESEDLRAIPNPLEMWSAYHRGVRREMRARGARVLLCGIGGDELLTSSPDPSAELADLLVECKLRDLHERLQVWSLALKKPYLEMLLQHTVIPALPRRLRSLHKRRERARPLALLQPGFIKRFNLHDRLLGPTDIFGFRRPGSRSQSTAFLSVMDVISSGYLHSWGPIEIRYPFAHRPLVEFLQAIPSTQWIRPGETRSLLRRALRGYLPQQIAQRKGKGSPAEATMRAAAREWQRLCMLLRDALVCSCGYVDPLSLKRLIDQPSPGVDLYSLSVIRISYLELWLQGLAKRAQTVRQMTPVAVSSILTSDRQQEVVQVYP